MRGSAGQHGQKYKLMQVAVRNARLANSLELPAIADDDLAGSPSGTGADGFNLFDYIVALHDLPEDNVLAVEMRRRGGADEELRAIGILAGIRHGKGAWAEVLAALAFKGFVI